jgi:hypothetical protein
MANLLAVLMGGALTIVGGFASNYVLESRRHNRDRRSLVLSKLEEAYELARSLPKWAANLYGHYSNEIMRASAADRSPDAWPMRDFVEGLAARGAKISDQLPAYRICAILGFYRDGLLNQAEEVQESVAELARGIDAASEEAMELSDQMERQRKFETLARPSIERFSAGAYRLAEAIQAEAKKIL